MRTSYTVRNPKLSKEGVKVAILAPPIRLNMNNFLPEKTLNMCLKLKKNIEHIRFPLKKIKPSKPTISINKTDIVIMTTNRCLGRTPHIRKNKLKWSCNYTTRI
jgi:hypothetical protein